MNLKKLLSVLIILILFIVINVYNSKSTNIKQTKIRSETLTSDKIDPSFDDYMIVFFSDLYYEDEEKLQDVVEKINLVNPDIVLFGGDLLKDKVDDDTIKILITYLSQISAKVGKYAVLGENDYLYLETVNEIYVNSNFKVLVNEGIKLFNSTGASINLIGLNSLSANIDIAKAFENSSSAYTIVLSHEPDSYDYINYGFDYFLCGHSLGGQIYFPLINILYRPLGAEKYYHGKYAKDDNTIDITNGVGTKEKAVRFMADSEIVFYKLRSH